MSKTSKNHCPVTVCGKCGSHGQKMELPDGTTYFHCQTCGGNKMKTVDMTEHFKLLTLKGFKHEK